MSGSIDLYFGCKLSKCVNKTEAMKSSPALRQLLIVVSTLLAGISAGASMGFPSILLYQLRKDDSEININLDTASWIGSIHGLAGILGVVAPFIMQYQGRKFTFIVSCLILIVGWTIAYTATGVVMILLSEILHGFSASVLIALCYDCLSEMITPSYRNVAVQSYNTVNVLGAAIPGVLSMFVNWRTACIILGAPVVLAIIISCSWLESPLWLAYKKDLLKCKVNFTKLRGNDEHSKKELKEVIAANTEKEVRNMANKRKSTIKHIWRQIARRDFIMPALHITVLINLTYWSGVVVVLLYSIELISKSTQNEGAAFIGSILINFALVLGSVVGGVLIKFYNNKPIILLSTAGATVCLVSVSVVTYLQSVKVLDDKSFLVIYLLVTYMVVKSFGGTVGFTMSSELMPVKHRGIGGCLFVVCSNSLHASVLKTSPYLFESLGLWGTFLIYTVNCLVCGLLIWKYVPETKHKTLQEIENFYSNGTFEISLTTEGLDEAEHIQICT